MSADNKQTNESNETLQQGWSDNPDVKKLQEENLKNLPQNADNRDALEAAIKQPDTTLEKQEAIKKYLETAQKSKVAGDFFKLGLNKAVPAVEFFEKPDTAGLTTLETFIRKQEERITKWERVMGKSFPGQSTEELAQFIGNYYEEKLMGQTPAPNADIFKRIGEPGKDNFRWTTEETTQNLNWKKQLVDGNMNPMEFLDWMDTNMKTVVEQRDKQIVDWAEQNVKTAESMPQLFSQQYLEQLKKIAEDAKAGKPNKFPIELLRDFESVVVPEQKKKRLEMEADAVKDIDANAKLLGPTRVTEWKQGWIKDAPFEEMKDWFKPEKEGAKRKFDTEIQKLKVQEEKFTAELATYPADADKQGFLDLFYATDSSKREECFDLLKAQKGKLNETQKGAVKTLADGKDFVAPEDTEALDLKNLAKLSAEEQGKKLEETKRAIEKRQHLLAKFKVREDAFQKDLKEIKDGTSKKTIKEAVKPIAEIEESLRTEACTSCIDALRQCETIRAEHDKPESKAEESKSFVELFQDSELEAEAFAAMNAMDEEEKQGTATIETPDVKKEVEIAKNAEEGDEKREVYREALAGFNQEQQAANDAKFGNRKEAANDAQYNKKAVDQLEKNVALGSPTFQNSIHEHPTFEAKHKEAQDKRAKEILKSNNDLNQGVEGAKEQILRLDLNNTDTTKNLNNLQADTAKKLRDTARAGKVEMVDASGKKLTKEKREETMWKRMKEKAGKWFGEKEAEKFSSTDLVDALKKARENASKTDTDETARKKLADNLRQSKIGKMKAAANDNEYKKAA